MFNFGIAVVGEAFYLISGIKIYTTLGGKRPETTHLQGWSVHP